MTADEVVEAALARCAELSGTMPSARSVYYRRIAIRQGQLFSRVTAIHPDYFGVSAAGLLVNGTFALSTLNPKAERITDVRVLAPGSSGLAAGERVNLVLLDDAENMLAPRATIRNQQLKGYGSDLTGVASVTIDYARRPPATVVKDAELDFPEQFQDLLVLDLARNMIGKLLDEAPGRRDAWIGLLSTEEADLLGTLDEHVRHYNYGEQRRFRPAGSPVPGADNG